MNVKLELTEREQAMLSGDQGEAKRFAMRILSQMAVSMGASRFVEIVSAHIDGCLFNGQVSLDFVNYFKERNAQVVVPTTLNVGTLDLIHPELFQGKKSLADAGRELMQAYIHLGCQASFTCAPYQLRERPAFGEHIAWAESNAIVFANSVLGARSNRYGDFIDLCAALTGCVPHIELHTDEGRRGQHVFRLEGFPDRLLEQESSYALLGLFVGRLTEKRIPVIDGLHKEVSEDALKALGAASATSGSVGLFHAVGVTPEALTLEDALQNEKAEQETVVRPQDLKTVYEALNSTRDIPLSAVCLGTPHFSFSEFERLIRILEAYSGRVQTEFYINTGRFVYEQLEQAGHAAKINDAGIDIVVDTCTYITPIIKKMDGIMMTNSGKWAYYAPGNLGVEVVFASLEDCVASAFAGKVIQDDSLWN